jgi:hypothetical protein
MWEGYLKELGEVKCVVEAYIVNGIYDIPVMLEDDVRIVRRLFF